MKIRKNAAEKHHRPRRYDCVPIQRRLIQLPLFALGITLIVEGLNKGSSVKLLSYILTRPWYFMYEWLIVLTTLVFSEIFKHRKSALSVISVLWIAAGVGNLLVIKSRTQPFVFNDILMLGDAIRLTTIYYTVPQIIAMYGSIFLMLVAVIFFVTKLPVRRHVNYTVAVSSFLGFVVLCVCLCTVGISYGVFPRYYDNLVDAYDQYGFPTCFVFTFGNMGVSKPSDYSDATVTDILDEIGTTQAVEETTPTQRPRPVFTEDDNLARPNIIYVQLESLFDVNTIRDSAYSEDPTPNFNALSRLWPSGELYMQSVGGGTANSEFEVLTGFSLDFFGAGEYPYSTVLKEKTCESVAYDLMEEGYSTTAMHNNTGTFYSRNEVYSRIGFEHFVSLEYMPYVTYTEIGWAQDIVLTDEIIKAMQTTDERDFVMAITVESHGKYEETYVPKDTDPVVLELPEQINRGTFTHYVHLIHETDKFIGALINRLETFDEPVICVFYGDHLPSLNLSADILTTNNLYASRYILWNNYGAKLEAPDIQAYRLSANLLKQLGISGGPIMRYHQSYPPECTDEEYMAKLKTLEYDLLYGNQTGYGDAQPPEAVNLMMGSVPIEITSVSNQYSRVLVNGKNFTEFSVIILDGNTYPTAFVSSAQIVCIVPKNLMVSEVRVAQIASDGTELSTTPAFRMSQSADG